MSGWIVYLIEVNDPNKLYLFGLINVIFEPVDAAIINSFFKS